MKCYLHFLCPVDKGSFTLNESEREIFLLMFWSLVQRIGFFKKSDSLSFGVNEHLQYFYHPRKKFGAR